MHPFVHLPIIFVFLNCADCWKEEVYDFVVVGGGLAGCVVAARLSEIREFNVLLLEAGGEPPVESQVPMFNFLIHNTKYDWKYTSTPQRNVNNRTFALPRGRMFGGTGSLNSMVWLRGHRFDFDYWEHEGATGWNWDNVLPYFMKSETDCASPSNRIFSGAFGPINLTNQWQNVTLFSCFIEEMKKLGVFHNDANDGEQIGYTLNRMNVFNNVRQSSYTNYLKPVLRRRNLHVIPYALVEKILLNRKREATGVLYSTKLGRVKVRAKKEVILCAGAINSPHLLMLSGIGPKQHLKTLGINVISDLPVGSNLQNHVNLQLNFSKSISNHYTKDNLRNFFNGKGPLTNYSAVTAFMNTNRGYDIADVQFTLIGNFYTVNPIKRLQYFLWGYVNRPKSRGTIRLISRNPKIYPKIDLNYLSHDYDVMILSQLAKKVTRISAKLSESQDEYSTSRLNANKCKHIDRRSENYWRCVARNNFDQACHYCCTCRMGFANNSSNVVDSELRVLGVRQLRVIDASVMPTIPSSNIQAVVVMIAERGADLIKQYYNKLNYFI